MNTFRKLLCSSFLWVLLVPYIFIGLGTASNQAVLIANHDLFPVMVNPVKLLELLPDDTPIMPPGQSQMIDAIHETMTNKTHLNALADVFDMQNAIYSLGDFSVMLGEWLGEFCPMVFIALVFKKCWDTDAV